MSLRNLDKESESDIEDFLFELKEFELYFVNGNKLSKAFGQRNDGVRAGQWRNLGMLYDIGWGILKKGNG